MEVYALLTELLYCCYFYTDSLTFYSSPYFLKCFPHFFLFFPHFSFALFAHFHFFSSPLTRFCSRHFFKCFPHFFLFFPHFSFALFALFHFLLLPSPVSAPVTFYFSPYFFVILLTFFPLLLFFFPVPALKILLFLTRAVVCRGYGSLRLMQLCWRESYGRSSSSNIFSPGRGAHRQQIHHQHCNYFSDTLP